MLRYITTRMGQSLVLLLLVSVIGFSLLHLMPGGPLSQFANVPGMSQAELEKIAAQMGLNRPLPVQYLDWLGHLLQGDWGRSYRDNNAVLTVIGEHLYATLLLMGTATLLAAVFGCWIGIKSALKRYSTFDHIATIGAMVAFSVPTFWLGLVAIYIFAIELKWLPAGNMYTVGDGSVTDQIKHLIMPSVVLAVVSIAPWSRYMRAATLETLDQEYIRTARAKGLHPARILRKHILRNALLPMITLAGLQVPAILGGALVLESVFTWPGMGRLFLDSLGYHDYPVIMGLLMFSAILVIAGNLAADILTAVADPRIRVG